MQRFMGWVVAWALVGCDAGDDCVGAECFQQVQPDGSGRADAEPDAGDGATDAGTDAGDAASDAEPEVGVCVPMVEACNGRDDDCDGATDEGFAGLGAACSAGVGACTREGRQVCDAAGAVVCSAQAGEAGPERCGDDTDNDCDGATDEGFDGLGAACTVGLGACARSGRVACQDGAAACDAASGMPTDEVCNGVDDDCDAAVDESFPEQNQACSNGVGACERAGSTTCEGGVIGCDAPAGIPEIEGCNLIDDDCDGVADQPEADFADCALPNVARHTCLAGTCGLQTCVAPWQDGDGRVENGCECQPGAPDEPDPDYFDANCDGMDGVRALGIFVSALHGNDAAAGTAEAPLRTLQAALPRAVAEDRPIYLDRGLYSVDTPLQLPAGVRIHGAYRHDPMNESWSRAPLERQPSRIGGHHQPLFFVGDGRPTVLDSIEVIADRAPPLESSMALRVRGDGLVLRGVRLVAGAGGDGVDGTAGLSVPSTPTPGVEGYSAMGPCPGCGGVAGRNQACPAVGGNGGDGARSARGNLDPTAGQNAPEGSPGGPAGGLGQPGAPGVDGRDGDHGRSTVGGRAAGRLDPMSFAWLPLRTADGGLATRGGGGGGGGGGGSDGVGRGGGGGGGGGGGCPGTPGQGAFGGGASIAMQVVAGQVDVIQSRLEAGPGGRGGHGGAGGVGQLFAGGGAGGVGCPTCGNGGPGGRGGSGGCGGMAGGGAGGPSLVILRVVGANDTGSVRFLDAAGQVLPDPELGPVSPGAIGLGGRQEGCPDAGGDGEAPPATPVACCTLGPEGGCVALVACGAAR